MKLSQSSIIPNLYYDSGVLLLSAYEVRLKAFVRTRNRKTDAIVFTYGKSMKPTGIFKIKFKRGYEQK